MPEDISTILAKKAVAEQQGILKNAPKPLFNTGIAQQYEGIPVSDFTLNSGTVADLAHTTEGYWTQQGKHAAAAGINTLGFAASTLAAIPNFIDNAFNDGNDRIVKPISDIQTNALKSVSIHRNTGEQGSFENLLPSWYTGNTHSFWGDVIEQSGIIAGTTLGTGLLLRGISLIPGTTAAGVAVNNVIRSTLSKAISPSTLLGESLAASKGIINTVNAQKFVNGLSAAAKIQGINAVQAYTEALFEGLDGERNFIEQRKQDYLEKYGEEATGTVLKEIEQNAKELKDSRFGLNIVGLMLTNMPMTRAFFGPEALTIGKRISNAGKAVRNGKFVAAEVAAFKNLPAFLRVPANVIAKVPFATMEGIEEVMQGGIDIGTDNYYTNKLVNKNFSGNFTDIAKSIGVGLDEGVFSKEGLDAFIVGAGVGSIFQGGHKVVSNRQFNKWLDKKVEGQDPSIAEEEQKTNKQEILDTFAEIDTEVNGMLNTDPKIKNIALNQTLGERIQDFVTASNNLNDSLVAEGSYVAYDQAQRTKFDNIFSYVKKGYKDVIQEKILGTYEQMKLDNPTMSREELATLEKSKQTALEEIELVNQFHETSVNVFNDKFTNSLHAYTHTALKDVATYHLWNIHNLDKQDKELVSLFGDTLFSDKILQKYDGTNAKELIEQEIKELTPKAGEIDIHEEKRKELKKLLNSKNLEEAYLEYKQKDRTGTKLGSKDFVSIKEQKERLISRINTNNDVITNLNNVKGKPEEALNFLLKYKANADNINSSIQAKTKGQLLRITNQTNIKKLVGTDLKLFGEVITELESLIEVEEISDKKINAAIAEVNKRNKKNPPNPPKPPTPPTGGGNSGDIDTQIAELNAQRKKELDRYDNNEFAAHVVFTPIITPAGETPKASPSEKQVIQVANKVIQKAKKDGEEDFILILLDEQQIHRHPKSSDQAFENYLEDFLLDKITTPIQGNVIKDINDKYDKLIEELKAGGKEEFIPVDPNQAQQEVLDILSELNEIYESSDTTPETEVQESFYKVVSKKINGYFRRVSNFIGKGIDYDSNDSVTNISNATVVGDFVDSIARDFFANPNLKFNAQRYLIKNGQNKEIVTEEAFNGVIAGLKSIYEDLVARHSDNFIIYTDQVLLTALLSPSVYENRLSGIAGSPDMLLIDEAGELHLYDFKTKKASLQYPTTVEKLETDYVDKVTKRTTLSDSKKWTNQQSVYAVMLGELVKPVASANIVVIPVDYEREDFTGNFENKKERLSFEPVPFNLSSPQFPFIYELDVEGNIYAESLIGYIEQQKALDELGGEIIEYNPGNVLSSVFSKVLSYLSLSPEGIFINNSKDATTTLPAMTEENTSVEQIPLSKEDTTNLFYDIGLIRTHTNSVKTNPFQVSIDGNKAFLIQNNQVNFHIDLSLLSDFINDNTIDSESENYSLGMLLKEISNTLPQGKKSLPFIDFLLALDSESTGRGEEIFNFIQTNTFVNNDYVKTGKGIVDIGKELTMFNFKGVTLKKLISHLQQENTLYQKLLANPNINIYQLIQDNLEVEFKGTPITKSASFNIPIKDSGAIENGVIFVKDKKIGDTEETVKYISSLLLPEVIDQIDELLTNNEFEDGYYAVFQGKDGKPYLANVRISRPFSYVKGDKKFRVGLFYTENNENKNVLYDVKIDENGNYSMLNSKEKEIFKGSEENFLAYVDKYAADKSSPQSTTTVSYYKEAKGSVLLEEIYNTGLTNAFMVPNTFVEVSPKSGSSIIKDRKKKVDPQVNLNKEIAKKEKAEAAAKLKEEKRLAKEEKAKAALEARKKKKVPKSEIIDPPVIAEEVIDIDIEGEGKKFLKNIVVENYKTFTVKPGVTQAQILKAIEDSDGMGPIVKYHEMLATFYEVKEDDSIPFSSISQFQLEKIKEFIKTC